MRATVAAKRRHPAGPRRLTEDIEHKELPFSHLGLFRHFQAIVDLDAELAHCRLHFGMAEQKLDCSEVPLRRQPAALRSPAPLNPGGKNAVGLPVTQMRLGRCKA